MRATRGVSLSALLITLPLLAAACGGGTSSEATQNSMETSPRLTSAPFGRTPDGRSIDLITLRNNKKTEVRFMTYGGIILSIKTADKDGTLDDITLGYDTSEAYANNSTYFGALIGRYANRIANASFTLDGQKYTLPANNGVNSLHGGKGWDQALWTADAFQGASGVGAVLTLTSPDGDQGYPGEVKATVTYLLNDDNEFKVTYEATTSKPTVINLTQHTYFNLAGTKANDILGHQLMINADRYTPVDDTLIPTGVLAPVDGTPFDFRTPTAIGARINEPNEQLTRGKGYDHNWVLNRTGNGLEHAAHVIEPVTGRRLDISTTEPGIQFYSGNFLDGTITGKGGKVYIQRGGFCLETQHFPDSPNQPSFPSTTLRPGETYHSETVFKFGVK
jgi:aldose 1-epimerase